MRDLVVIINTHYQNIKAGTIIPLLQSMVKVKDVPPFYIFNNSLNDLGTEELEKIVSRYQKNLRIKVIPTSNWLKLYSKIAWDFEYKETLERIGYANFRNLGLLLAIKNDSDIMFLDDDETIPDSNFFTKVRKIVRDAKTIGLGGVAGYYVDSKGSYLITDPYRTGWWKLAWDKEKWMNLALVDLKKTKRFTDNPFTVGGVLIIFNDLAKKVPFDPLIPRGEDMDYTAMAKHFGDPILTHPDFFVVHNKEFTTNEYWRKFYLDIERFIYMKIKLGQLDIEPSTLDPYPGKFLRFNLFIRIFLTAVLLSIHEFFNGDLTSSIKSIGALKFSYQAKKKFIGKNANYLRFREKWLGYSQGIAKLL